jgi:5-methylcytosine-specific restriction endonuclease McrA
MRLIRDLPETEKAIQDGRLSLTAAAQAQTYFREVSKTRGPILRQEKIAILAQLEGRSTRECERTLIALDPNPILPAEKTKPLSEEHTLIQFVADRDLLNKLEKLKGLLAHQNFAGDYAKLFNRLADLGLEKLGHETSARATSRKGATGRAETRNTKGVPSNPESKKKNLQSADGRSAGQVKSENTTQTRPETKSHSKTQPATPSRYIPAAVKREVWKRDGGRCIYVDPKTSRRCSSRHGLQFDHIHPHAHGGEGSAQNLQLLCGAHNRYRAEKMGFRRR